LCSYEWPVPPALKADLTATKEHLKAVAAAADAL
jgi:hypothetical protein